MLLFQYLGVALLPLAQHVTALSVPTAASGDVVLTNAERFAQGLAPLKPNPNKRQLPSGVPTTTQKGYLYAVQNAVARKRAGPVTTGCVISDGSWYVGGTCATYTATIAGDSATFSTSKGPCGIVAGAFSCAAGNTATVFALASDGTLSYSSSSAFSADQVPASSVRQTVYVGGSHAVPLTLNFASGAYTQPPSSTATPTSSSSSSSAPYPTGTGLTVCSASDPSAFPLSCSGGNVGDTCCTDSPGGHLLLTQFWDTGASSTGPNTSWTLHGLWPDKCEQQQILANPSCDGTYEQFCDPSREYTNITQILQANGQSDLLSYMDVYWKDYQGNDETFWEHEWNKHGTCISSVEPRCFNNYKPQQDVVVYFNRAVVQYKQLPSYDWLAQDGIVPSLTQTYTLAQIQGSLSKHFGHEVNVNCKGSEFDEIWYHYISQGGIASGNIIPADLVGSKSTCPATGIKYYPKYVDLTNPPTTTTTTTGTPTPTPTGIPPKAYVYPTYTDGTREAKACLISDGTWYKGGTCPMYTAAAVSGGYTLSTSKGLCGLVSNTLSCASTVTAANAAVWTIDADGSLTTGGVSGFSAAAVPSGSTRQPLSAGDGAINLKLVYSNIL